MPCSQDFAHKIAYKNFDSLIPVMFRKLAGPEPRPEHDKKLISP